MISKSTHRSALSIALLLAVASTATAQQATTAPAGRTEAKLLRDIQTEGAQVNKLIGDEAAMGDAEKRPAIATEAVPLLKQLKADFASLAVLQPQAARQAKSIALQVNQTLSVLGDAEGIEALNQLASSGNPSEALVGKGAQLAARWTAAGKDEAAQTRIADELDALDHAHPESASLTLVTAQLSRGAATSALGDRLLKLATETMNNPAVAQVKVMREQADATAKLKQNEGKPFVLAGASVDGNPFTTADWAGKVILVDFWATWCGPCKAELPNVQKLYASRHADGLEIVGVSNDYTADALRTFTRKEHMPWPELFDASAAAEHQWNPTTLGYGIEGIPHMFVIDKQGILRSSDARADYEELVTKLLRE